ncbi:hypothetical protein [Candidatus Halobonum tyrrellensis]|uniref:Integral membrane protein n=1 Tax=Candidatus Halobonum tyrrellensis G22 TaxID=1324957 RepID=V4GV74_9EURY|nr:hypothetical protein [Candidatus Halobonum tyrrellensis]ESP89056.1 hypothetical protein K933_05928 [Candidatus Halobonum tyrrellensis G22]
MRTDFPTLLVGADRDRSVRGVTVAAGLFAVVLVVSLLPLAVGAVVEPGLVVGFGLAAWWAYDDGGLAVSVALVVLPVAGRLTYYWWYYLDRPAPPALPLSFGGHGAWEAWVPLAVLLGAVAFGVGTLLRCVRRFVGGPKA